MLARLSAVTVLPSPDAALVTWMTCGGGPDDENINAVRSMRKVSAIGDHGIARHDELVAQRARRRRLAVAILRLRRA